MEMEMELPVRERRSRRSGALSALMSAAEEVLSAPGSVLRYYRRLSAAFGWRFVALVSIVYGVNQGMGEQFFGVAKDYFFSDEPPEGLGLPPARALAISGFANVPWQIKSVYGIISDSLPIFDLHRTPYILGAGLLGLVSWSGLWLWPLLTASLAGFLLFSGNLSIASPDVMIDASVAERCKTHPVLASDLQTLCWASFGIGKILSAATAGKLYDSPWCGSRGLFGLTAVTSVVMVVPAALGWLDETPASQRPKALERELAQESPAGRRGAAERACPQLCAALKDKETSALYRLSVFVMLVSISLGSLAKGGDDNFLIFLAAVVAATSISLAVYYTERSIDMRLARSSVYIFLSGAVQPSSSLMFYWARETPENCSRGRPCFSPEFLSAVDVVGYVVFVLGASAYNKYFSGWTYKRIWASTQIMLAMTGFLDLILVLRLNLLVGVPDWLFLLGDEILGDLVRRINTMPLFVLAAATCPDGVEATLFAMNMGLSNFGSTLGGFAGIGLMTMLGGISQPEFNNLPAFVVIRSLCRLLPLLLIPFFVPDGTPRDEGAGGVDHNDDGLESLAEADPAAVHGHASSGFENLESDRLVRG